MEDANSWDEVERRRKEFVAWLTKAWMWADENEESYAADMAYLLSHADEADFPLWQLAERYGLIGKGGRAAALCHNCGLPPSGPKANDWERGISFSPVIRLEEKVWRQIHGGLGWANRDYDINIASLNFWLVSQSGNIVRFIANEPVAPVEPVVEE